MVAKIEPQMTVDDLDAMPEDGNRYEVIEGELFVSRAPGLPHQIITGNILHQFMNYLDENPIGRIVSTPGLILSRHSGVIPDLVFYSHARGDEIIWNERLNAAPEIVIEILSAGRENISRDRVTKRRLYAKHGVSEYWIVDSENRSIEIYRVAGESLDLATLLRNDDQVTSPVLPGFSCPLAKIFEP
ncbi:MAG: Uma2 family endonuclease [Pyrinomonadaceae bacterium]